MSKEKVAHLGGVFIYANEPKKLAEWYKEHLGLTYESWGENGPFGVIMPYKDNATGQKSNYQIWSIMKSKDTLEHKERNFTLNLRVNNCKALVEELRGKGMEVNDVIVDEYGLFSWLSDAEGNHIELWEDTKSEGANS